MEAQSSRGFLSKLCSLTRSPYIDSGVVEYTYWPGKYIQIASYVDAVKRHKFDCKWLAAIDGDEFILPLNDKSIGETLNEIVAQDDRIGAVVVHWQMFGSSHHIKKPDGGVLKNFTHCGEKLSDLVKSITYFTLKFLQNEQE